MSFTRISVKPYGGALGALIEGVDLGLTLDNQTYSEIKQALLQYQCLTSAPLGQIEVIA